MMQRTAQEQKTTQKLFAWIVPAVAAAIMLAGCGINATPIRDIIASPANYDGKEVTLRGIAKNATRIPLVDMKSYVLKDDTGEIMVLTAGDLPKTDEKLTIKAKVANLAIINGEALGTTVTEISRH